MHTGMNEEQTRAAGNMPAPSESAMAAETLAPPPALPTATGGDNPAFSETKNGTLVQVKDLYKQFLPREDFFTRLLDRKEAKPLRAVDGVSLSIPRQQIVGLVGESGSGKSTLGKLVVGLHKPSSGQIFFDGEEISGYSAKQMRQYHQRVQMIFQNPYASLNPRKTVRDIVADPLRLKYHMQNPRQLEDTIMDLLEKVGLPARAINLYPHQFSGGQRQRIGIARAIAMGPEFIVADEPVSALDVSVQAQIINLLQDLKEEYNLTYLFIAHDLSVVYHISDLVAVMYLGRIVESATTAELFTNPLHPYTEALLSASPELGGNSMRDRIILKGTIPSPKNIPAGCRFAGRCFKKIGGICDQVDPPNYQPVPGHCVACHLYAGAPEGCD